MISTALMAQDGTEPGALERADRQPDDVPGSMVGEELLAGLGPVPDGTPSSPDVAGAERHRPRSRVRSR